MSEVNKIILSYQEYKSYTKTNKNSKLVNRSYSMALGNRQDNEKFLGSTAYIDAGTNVRCEWKAEYDNNFTSDMPLIRVTTSSADGDTQEYVVNIDEVDVSAASGIELFALCNYADAHGMKTESANSSWELLRAYIKGDVSSKDYGQKMDWLTMVGEAKDEYMEAKLYKQVTDGNKLTHLLEKYGMPKEVEMIQVDIDILIPVDNGTKVCDVDGGYAQIQFNKNGEINYINHLNNKANWTMEVSQEMLKKAQELDSEFVWYMSDQSFWESYLNGNMSLDDLKAITDYKTIRSDFFEHLSEPVKQAWERAVAETGIDAFGVEENGELLYPSEFIKQYMLARLRGESTEFYDNIGKHVLEFAQKSLSQLQNINQPKYNADIQYLKDKELSFYQNLINILS